MAGEYGMRGEAATRLMKGKKGAPPPEEDELGLPPEEGMPPEEGAGDMGGLASLLGGAGAPPGEEPMPEEMPADEMGGMPPEPMDLDSALAGVEGAMEGLPPEAAEEIRTHLNAIREIAAQAGTQQQALPEEAGAPSPEAPPQPDGGAAAGMGMMEPQA